MKLEFKLPPNYRPQAEDTRVETDAFEFYLLRQRSNSERLQMGAATTRGARKLSLHCLRHQFASLTEQQFASKVAVAWLQEDCPPNFIPTGNSMTWIQDSTALASQLHRILESLTIPYYITGGVAAIAYGEPRTTRDVDVVIEMTPTALDRLVQTLEQEGFYVPGVEDVRSGRLRSLGITHIESISRADLVISGSSELERLKFERRRMIEVPENGALYFLSPEDLILAKLLWGQHSSSEKQWRDVLGVLKVQAESLDYDYLVKWAEPLQLTERLFQAFSEAGIE